MKRTGRLPTIIFVLCAALFARSVLWAQQQEVSFDASVDRETVPLDEYVTLSLSVSGARNAPEPSQPPLDNLSVISRSHSTNISIINGQMSSSVSFVYILKPLKEGEATIGSASITIDGKTYQTQPIKIKVTPPSGSATPPSSRRQSPQRTNPYFPFGGLWDEFEDFFNTPMFQSMRVPQIENPILAQTTISKNTAYVNEMLILTFTFYRAVDLYSQPSYSPPETTGFWSINLPGSKNMREVNIKGVRYLAQDFKTAIFPTTSGKLTIGPASITAQIDPFSNPVTAKTKPITINVLPLPDEGKPPYFSGAVGKFTLSAACQTREIERGKPFTITAKIIGEGNIQTVSQPHLEMSSNSSSAFKILNTSSQENIVTGFNSVSGSKSFEIILMPLKEGEYRIGPLKFAYFNPASRKYIELSSGGQFEIKILPSRTPIPRELEDNLAGQDKSSSAGEKTLKISFDWKSAAKKIIKFALHPVVLTFTATLILFILVGYLVKKYIRHQKSDPVKWRRKQAVKTARKRLKKSASLLKANKMKEFTAEIYEAVAGYLGDKFNFSSSGITTDKLREILQSRGIPPELQTRIENFASECDLYRFTPSHLDTEEARRIFKTAEELIISIESAAD